MRDLIKTIALIKRRPDLSRLDFAKHYEEVHVPLALRHFGDWRGYIRNHVEGVLVGRPPAFDCITETWFADAEDRRTACEGFRAEAAALAVVAVCELESICGE